MGKRTDNAPLDAIRLSLKDHAVTLQPIVNQVSALPSDPQLEFYFVPVTHMEFYRPYYRPGQPFKNLKLVNFGQPAISLSFFSKHKYKIDRNVKALEAMRQIREHREKLFNYSLVGRLSIGQQQELQRTDELLRQIRDDPDSFQFCFSNYHHYYMYWYCSFRFFEDDTNTQTASSMEHLLKHTERVEGKVHERLNIIFIDPQYITRPVPYDSKLIDRELATYPIQLKQGITTLYIRNNINRKE
ncbi:hypothetical protein LX87_04652 [Larkinella arboricola]|uniref:Uncharacterized protein n=2 Tax=Larkinella arboricola TaxID=643671 RepID=A0A327WVK6_LARAB|nr:hypothetical protein LX87_04652 [Larkinella arboricola]